MTKFFFLIRLGLRNIVQHRKTSWPLILSLFVLISLNLLLLLGRANINTGLDFLTSRARLEIILRKGLSQEEVASLIGWVRDNRSVSVRNITFRDETENLNDFAAQDETLAQAVELLGENPLPPTLTVQCSLSLETLKNIEGFAGALEKRGEVLDVIYPGEWFALLFRITRGAELFFLFLLGALFLVTYILWVSIFKATLYPLKEEIEIMEIVGGTKLYIRTPFYIESLFYALLSFGGSLALFHHLFSMARIPLPGLSFIPPDDLAAAGGLTLLLALLGTEKAINRFFR